MIGYIGYAVVILVLLGLAVVAILVAGPIGEPNMPSNHPGLPT